MKLLQNFNNKLIRVFIRDFQQTDNKKVRVQYGLLAGWVGSRPSRSRLWATPFICSPIC